MDFKRLISHFTYRIEPKPEGGFIARATDPAVPPLEAATREELQQKIQANIASALAAEFPGLKLALENRQHEFAFHIEHTPQGGFAIHSADPDATPVKGATHNDIEGPFAEKLVNFFGKHYIPELSRVLAEQPSGDIKVVVNTRTGLTVNTTSNNISREAARDFSSIGPTGTDAEQHAVEEVRSPDTSTSKANFLKVGDDISNVPITPETSSNWPIFRLLLGLLIIALVMYFFFHHR